jgi:hypothetical protein
MVRFSWLKPTGINTDAVDKSGRAVDVCGSAGVISWRAVDIKRSNIGTCRSNVYKSGRAVDVCRSAGVISWSAVDIKRSNICIFRSNIYKSRSAFDICGSGGIINWSNVYKSWSAVDF